MLNKRFLNHTVCSHPYMWPNGLSVVVKNQKLMKRRHGGACLRRDVLLLEQADNYFIFGGASGKVVLG